YTTLFRSFPVPKLCRTTAPERKVRRESDPGATIGCMRSSCHSYMRGHDDAVSPRGFGTQKRPVGAGKQNVGFKRKRVTSSLTDHHADGNGDGQLLAEPPRAQGDGARHDSVAHLLSHT